jgi:hypothetical protein
LKPFTTSIDTYVISFYDNIYVLWYLSPCEDNQTVEISSDAFHNEKTITINFIVEMTSLILVQIIIEKNVVKKIAQYNL